MNHIGATCSSMIIVLFLLIPYAVVSDIAAAQNIESTAVSEGKCLRFDGVDDVVNAGDVDALDSAQQLTAEMWVRIDAFSAWRTFFCKFRNLANRIQFQEYSEPGKIAVVVNNGANIPKEGNQAYYATLNPEVTIGNWFHLAMVFDGTLPEDERLKLYINGMARTLKKEGAARGAVPVRLPATAAPLLLGAEKTVGEYGYKGLMDEIRIWTVARSPEQIRENMEHMLQGTEDGLQLYYAVDNGSAAAKLLLDRTSGKNHAKLVNFDLNTCFVDRGVAIPSVAAGMLRTEDLLYDRTRLLWVRGSGSANLVFATDGDTGLPQPVNGVTYTADSVYGKGSRIGETQWYCVYNGYEAQAPVTSLKSSSGYRVAVVDYNGASGHEQYKADSSLPVLLFTTVAAPAKKRQEITFELPEKITTDQKTIFLNANTSSRLPMKYTSSNSSVAAIVGDSLRILAPGEVTVTASQAGDATWAAADVSLIMEVRSAEPIPLQQPVAQQSDVTSKKIRLWLIAGGAAIFTGTVIGILLSDGESGGGSSIADDRPPSDPTMATQR
jgi:hypothetical protein